MTEAFAIAASGPAPSSALRERILAQSRAEPQLVVPLDAARSRRTVPVLAAVAAVAAVVALAVGLWATSLSSDLDEARAALEREQAAAAVLADPDARTVALQEGAGRLVVGSDGRAVLVLDGLDPPLGEDLRDVDRAPASIPALPGLFPGRDGIDIVALDGIVDER